MRQQVPVRILRLLDGDLASLANFLDERIAIAYYPPAYPVQDIPLSELAENFKEIYLIWYAGSELSGFKEVYRSGDISQSLRKLPWIA